MYKIVIGCPRCGQSVIEGTKGHLEHNADPDALWKHTCPSCGKVFPLSGIELDMFYLLVAAEKTRIALEGFVDKWAGPVFKPQATQDKGAISDKGKDKDVRLLEKRFNLASYSGPGHEIKE